MRKTIAVFAFFVLVCLVIFSAQTEILNSTPEFKGTRDMSPKFEIPAIQQPELKSVTVHRATGKIWIDGNFDEPAWLRTEPLGPFLLYPTHDPGTAEATVAKMLWDDECLYILYTTTDKNIVATRTQRYEDVFNDDCVEAFLSPFAEAPQIYTNIEINALGTFLSEIHLAKPDPEIEKMPLVVASHYTPKPGHYLWSPPGLQIGRRHKGTINLETDEDSWWTIEMSIPFSTFRHLGMKENPKEGTVWRFNLYRIGGKNLPPRRNLFYLPEPMGNHSPEYYGRLVFAD